MASCTRARQGNVCAVTLERTHYGCGSKFGYLEAIVDFAFAHADYGDDFRELVLKIMKCVAAK